MATRERPVTTPTGYSGEQTTSCTYCSSYDILQMARHVYQDIMQTAPLHYDEVKCIYITRRSIYLFI